MQNNANQCRERDVTIGSNLYAKKWRKKQRMYAPWTGCQPVVADYEVPSRYKQRLANGGFADPPYEPVEIGKLSLRLAQYSDAEVEASEARFVNCQDSRSSSPKSSPYSRGPYPKHSHE
jgi:hypothetical protein